MTDTYETPIAERSDAELPELYQTVEDVISDCKKMLLAEPTTVAHKTEVVKLMSMGYTALSEIVVEMTKRGLPVADLMRKTLAR